MFELRSINDVFERIQHPLLEICEGELEDFSAIVRACQNDEAKILVAPDIFVIVHEDPDAFLIWVAHSSGVGGVVSYLPELERLAKACGYKRIRFRTRRKGFEKVLDEGWKKMIEWEKELVDGT